MSYSINTLLKQLTYLTVVILSFLGCRKTPGLVNISHAPVSIKSIDYPKLLKRWTRKEKIIQKFDTTLDVTATLLSYEFRSAYVSKYARFFRLEKSDRDKLWGTQKEELNDKVRFVVAVACTDSKWNDLDKGTPTILGPGKEVKGSMWRITLKVDDHKTITPLEVTAMEPIRKIHRHLFPYLGYFHRLYTITFQRRVNGTDILPSTARIITLQFTGPLGTTKLKWFTSNYIVPEHN